MERRILFIALLFAAIGATNHLARAEGSVALGVPADIAKDGLAAGYSVDAPTTDGADALAMESCHKLADSEGTGRLCKVVAHFRNQCVAIAWDPQIGTSGWGWAIADAKPDAETNALANCANTAGSEHAAACTVQASNCDGSAK